MKSPDANRLFSCFAESLAKGTSGNTLQAFIFSLKSGKDLPPFKCLATERDGAIYKSSYYGPTFGKSQALRIFGIDATRSRAWIKSPYTVPAAVSPINDKVVLAGIGSTFRPTNYEVFYLTGPNVNPQEKQKKKAN